MAIHTPSARIRGFTFLEIMLVVMILTAALAVAMPNFRPVRDKYDLGQSARHVVGMMRYARATALARQEYAYLDFDLTEMRVALGTKRDDDEESRSRARRTQRKDREDEPPEIDDTYRSFELPRGVRFKALLTYEELFYEGGRRARIYFYPDGKASRTTVLLEGKRPGGRGEDDRIANYTVELYRATGLVSSYRGAPEESKALLADVKPLAGRRSQEENFVELVSEMRGKRR